MFNSEEKEAKLVGLEIFAVVLFVAFLLFSTSKMNQDPSVLIYRDTVRDTITDTITVKDTIIKWYRVPTDSE